AFVPWTRTDLAEILCHQEDRVVGKDNTVTFGKLRLQIEPSPLRVHFVKATVELRRYADHTIGLFYGPRCIGRYAADGALLVTQSKAALPASTTADLIRGMPRIKSRTKRTTDLLRIPDHFTCYRHLLRRAISISRCE